MRISKNVGGLRRLGKRGYYALRPLIARIWAECQICGLVWDNPDIIFGSHVKVGPDCVFGSNVFLGDNTVVTRTRLGRFSYIGRNGMIEDATIGAFCSIGPEVLVGLGVHPTQFVSSSPVFYSPHHKAFGRHFASKQETQEHASVRIGNDVWIGARVTVLGGVTIGDGVIIGAGAVVVKDVAPYTIVGGVPAKMIRRRFSDDQIQQLLEIKWWDRSENWLEEHAARFANIGEFLGIGDL